MTDREKVKDNARAVELTKEQADFVRDYAQLNHLSFNRAIEHIVSFFAMCVYTQNAKKGNSKAS